jgi:hypothetical protein
MNNLFYDYQCCDVARRFDIVQQISWMVYFYYENLVFLARMKLFGYEEASLDYMTNLSWLIGTTDMIK